MSADRVLVSTVERLLAERHPAGSRLSTGRAGFAPEVWTALEETGLCGIGVAEESGGSGGGLEDAAAVASLLAAAAVPVPYAETALVAGPMLAAAGLELPTGAISVPCVRPADVRARAVPGGIELSGALRRVPFGSRAAAVVFPVAVEGSTRLVSVPGSATSPSLRNLAGEERSEILLDGVVLGDDHLGAPGVGDWDELERRGALARSVQLAGALGRVAELTVAYAWSRRQFGRPIASFQAVQIHLVALVGEAERAGIATKAAMLAATGGDAAFEIAAAKAITSAAAGAGASHAHQAHGAIGMTEEYELHHLTRRLWCWREEFGNARHWHRVLGRLVVEAGADGFWQRLAAPLVPPVAAGEDRGA